MSHSFLGELRRGYLAQMFDIATFDDAWPDTDEEDAAALQYVVSLAVYEMWMTPAGRKLSREQGGFSLGRHLGALHLANECGFGDRVREALDCISRVQAGEDSLQVQRVLA